MWLGSINHSHCTMQAAAFCIIVTMGPTWWLHGITIALQQGASENQQKNSTCVCGINIGSGIPPLLLALWHQPEVTVQVT